jgi:hypothetical protein
VVAKGTQEALIGVGDNSETLTLCCLNFNLQRLRLKGVVLMIAIFFFFIIFLMLELSFLGVLLSL